MTDFKNALYQAGKYAGTAFFSSLGASSLVLNGSVTSGAEVALVSAGIAAGIAFFAHLPNGSMGTTVSVTPA